ncbi:hypothetical protein [Phenylobacterium sp.]|uniref:hypothetical protein n=1 Tax=Phenylobacterium sp. TaxID=1871053 RepID=UPI002735A731|nr:hypothetical protein [Phenylobacterium sp.]MDP3853891.1 hypothetical protein [Phenylobacterium sp.]
MPTKRPAPFGVGLFKPDVASAIRAVIPTLAVLTTGLVGLVVVTLTVLAITILALLLLLARVSLLRVFLLLLRIAVLFVAHVASMFATRRDGADEATHRSRRCSPVKLFTLA